jgi:hypothetical protein
MICLFNAVRLKFDLHSPRSVSLTPLLPQAGSYLLGTTLVHCAYLHDGCCECLSKNRALVRAEALYSAGPDCSHDAWLGTLVESNMNTKRDSLTTKPQRARLNHRRAVPDFVHNNCSLQTTCSLDSNLLPLLLLIRLLLPITNLRINCLRLRLLPSIRKQRIILRFIRILKQRLSRILIA